MPKIIKRPKSFLWILNMFALTQRLIMLFYFIFANVSLINVTKIMFFVRSRFLFYSFFTVLIFKGTQSADLDSSFSQFEKFTST